jgi:hypothetical protein
MTEPRPSDPPRDVTRAFWLWIAGLVVSIGNLLVALPNANEAIARATAQPGGSAPGTRLTADQLHSIAHTGLVATLVFTVVLDAVLVLFAVKMRAGRNWARVVITIYTAVQVIMLAFTSTHGVLQPVLGSLSGALALAAAVLLYYRPETRGYFTPIREPVVGP